MLDESAIIKFFQEKLGNKKFVAEDVEVFNIGKTKVIAKIDTLVQSTDIPQKMKIRHAARKSIVACISDFAAKGVNPQYGIISLNLPKGISRLKLNEIAEGLKEASREFNITILGGDTNEGKEIVFNACLFGTEEKIIRRKGAKIGDRIFVTGPFGYTAAGLEILLKGVKGDKNFVRRAIKSVIHPSPKLDFGIKNRNYFTSSMDSSDGLSTTLNEMANQSRCKFIINYIPIENDLMKFAKLHKIDANKLIFHGGEEYEFVFTAPEKFKSRIKKNAFLLKTPIIEIGYVKVGNGVFLEKNENFVPLKDLGWHHFRK